MRGRDIYDVNRRRKSERLYFSCNNRLVNDAITLVGNNPLPSSVQIFNAGSMKMNWFFSTCLGGKAALSATKEVLQKTPGWGREDRVVKRSCRIEIRLEKRFGKVHLQEWLLGLKGMIDKYSQL
ncbi:hypothetical protein TNCV_4769961 [Trichonephila clavipes]|nr:hypothetical protein TNCV_4769961 [Trichonephila clavipes]